MDTDRGEERRQGGRDGRPRGMSTAICGSGLYSSSGGGAESCDVVLTRYVTCIKTAQHIKAGQGTIKHHMAP